MTVLIVAIAFVVLLVVVAVATSLVSVPDGKAFVLERGGRFRAVLPAGRHFVLPFADKVRARVDVGEQIMSFRPHSITASDGAEVMIEIEIRFVVVDPRAATYEIANPAIAIEQLAVTALRAEISLLTAERAIASPDELHRTVWTVLHDTTGRWGIGTTGLDLAVSPPAAPETPSTAQEWY
jgi:regulator of protease activity HflC (stomatin/prohibitin superfamily)